MYSICWIISLPAYPVDSCITLGLKSVTLENAFPAENAVSAVVQSEVEYVLVKPHSLTQRNVKWLKSSEAM